MYRIDDEFRHEAEKKGIISGVTGERGIYIHDFSPFFHFFPELLHYITTNGRKCNDVVFRHWKIFSLSNILVSNVQKKSN